MFLQMPSVPFTLLLQPELSDNIKKENISDQHIYITGNTVIDALLWMKIVCPIDLSNPYMPVLILRKSIWTKIILITGHRRESFGDGFLRICTSYSTTGRTKSRRSFDLSRTSQSKCTKASLRFAI